MALLEVFASVDYQVPREPIKGKYYPRKIFQNLCNPGPPRIFIGRGNRFLKEKFGICIFPDIIPHIPVQHHKMPLELINGIQLPSSCWLLLTHLMLKIWQPPGCEGEAGGRCVCFEDCSQSCLKFPQRALVDATSSGIPLYSRLHQITVSDPWGLQGPIWEPLASLGFLNLI